MIATINKRNFLKTQNVILIGVLGVLSFVSLVFPTLAWSQGSEAAANDESSKNPVATAAAIAEQNDLRVPGEPNPAAVHVNEKHPWSIVEKHPASDTSSGRLEVLQNDSPRSLLWSLGRALKNYQDLLETEGHTYGNRGDVDWIQGRIADCFDVSDIAPEFQVPIAVEAAVFLRGTIRRVPMPAWESIPDKQTLDAMDKGDRITHYRFDELPIELIQIKDGERAGQWVISRNTREDADEDFARVKDLKPVAAQGSLIDLHFTNPGWLIPSEWIRNLPDWSRKKIFRQAVWQWIVTGIVTLLVFAVMILLALLGIKRSAGHAMTNKARLVELLFFLAAGGTLFWLIYFIRFQVMLSGLPLEIMLITFSIIGLVFCVFAIIVASTIVAELIISSPAISSKGVDAAIIRIVARATSILLALVIVFKGLAELGFSPNTLLAGASVTGLAVALACQDILKNFFSSVTLLLEKPFREGDMIQFEDDFGRVELLGLRSTCIRLLNGNLVYLSNDTISHGRIENFSKRPYIKCGLELGLPYDTSCDKIDQAKQIVKGILEEKVTTPPGRDPYVLFDKFADCSLNLKARYCQASEPGLNFGELYRKARSTSEEVNLEILKQFRENDIGFAFPTITLDVENSIHIEESK